MSFDNIENKSIDAKWLRAGVLDTDGMVLHPATGTPQGGITSCTLANIYLHYALDDWFERKFKPGCRGDAMMVRYADDWVAGFQFHGDAAHFQRVVEERLKTFGLSLAKEKCGKGLFTRHRKREAKRFDFPGVEFRWGRTREVRAFPIKDAEGKVIYVVEYVRDITEKIQAQEDRLQLEQQLQQNQRLESLGILAGGIAHDFNNLLGGIYGFLDMARAKSADPEVNQCLDSSLTTMNRARNLTQQLLTFAKGGAPNRRTGSLVKFVRETTDFALSGSSVSYAFNIPDNLWPCDFDANQMAQVMDNIVINAVQAMPMGGKLEITATNLNLQPKTHSTLPGGAYIRLSFRDSGIGIPTEILRRLFDPLFTTKQKGSGLGLATSFSIVKKHDGCIEVESEPGKGSTFHVYLPASSHEETVSEISSDSTPRAAGIVIVMDDEEVMRKSIGQMLEYGGYSPKLAKDDKDALNLFNEFWESRQEIAAIFLDLTVPGEMGGKETVEEIRKKDKRVPVFVASGYADDPIVQSPQDYGFTDSIAKPFLRTDLYKLISEYSRKT